MGPEEWAMYVADRLKIRFEEALKEVSPYDLGYALMDCMYELGKKMYKEEK